MLWTSSFSSGRYFNKFFLRSALKTFKSFLPRLRHGKQLVSNLTDQKNCLKTTCNGLSDDDKQPLDSVINNKNWLGATYS